MQLRALRRDVERRFDDARPHLWDDPRPDFVAPEEADYSRCADPDKYVVVQQRCRAWVAAIEHAGLATARPSSGVLGSWGQVQTHQLLPAVDGATHLFVHLTGDSLPGVVLALGHPDATLTSVPACGCDACDSGSAVLLAEIDEVFDAVLCGRAEVIHTATGSAVRLPGSWSSASGSLEPVVLGRGAARPGCGPSPQGARRCRRTRAADSAGGGTEVTAHLF